MHRIERHARGGSLRFEGQIDEKNSDRPAVVVVEKAGFENIDYKRPYVGPGLGIRDS